MNCGLKAYRAEVVHGMQLYGELHRYIPVLAHYRGYRVTELPVNHRPREHGRSQLRRRALRARLPRPPHGHVHGPLPPSPAAPLRRRRAPPQPARHGDPRLPDDREAAGHAIGQRPLLLLGVLLVVVGIQLLSLGLLSELITSHHEERTGGARPRGAGSWTKSCARRVRVLYFGTYDRAYPRNAQVISACAAPASRSASGIAPVWERRHNWSVGLRQMLRVAEAERSLRRCRDDAAMPTR